MLHCHLFLPYQLNNVHTCTLLTCPETFTAGSPSESLQSSLYIYQDKTTIATGDVNQGKKIYTLAPRLVSFPI